MNEMLKIEDPPHIRYYTEVEQGSEEWLALRCGMITASCMDKLLTPGKLEVAANDKQRAHLDDLVAQRLTKYVEPGYVSFDMARGKEDEIEARALYAEHYSPVQQVGFVTNNRWGFTIGYSPDGLVGSDGLIECKSRAPRFQVATLCSLMMPADYLLQVQTGLLVSEREWLDFISYCGGLPMLTLRCYPDKVVQEAIIAAAEATEKQIAQRVARYQEVVKGGGRLIPTTRRVVEEIY